VDNFVFLTVFVHKINIYGGKRRGIMETLEEMKHKYVEKYSDKKLVFGDGNVNSLIMLVGEAPGGEEEKLGRPFVGRAGKNLDEFLLTVGIDRKKLYITNVVKYRPISISEKTGKVINRTPSWEEMMDFMPLLKKEIETINPKLIVSLGNVPLRALMNSKSITIGNYHGKEININGYKLYPLYHPASVIYNRGLKEIYIEDVKGIKKYIS
jgi:DNA polymerase